MFFQEVLVPFDLLPEVFVFKVEVLDTGSLLLDVVLDLVQLVDSQTALLLCLVLHVFAVKHVDPARLVTCLPPLTLVQQLGVALEFLCGIMIQIYGIDVVLTIDHSHRVLLNVSSELAVRLLLLLKFD